MHDLVQIARASASDELALAKLHALNVSPVRAIKALIDGRGLSLKQAKEKLMKSSAWKVEAEKANNLHDQIDAFFDE